jgi:hypothetical protein
MKKEFLYRRSKIPEEIDQLAEINAIDSDSNVKFKYYYFSNLLNDYSNFEVHWIRKNISTIESSGFVESIFEGEDIRKEDTERIKKS